MKIHELSEYISLLEAVGLVESISCDINLKEKVLGITYNSKEVNRGSLFICKGAAFKKEFLLEAEAKGASCYISEKEFGESNLPCILVNDIRKAMPLIASFYFEQPEKKLSIIGITGTKGKSTTAYFIKNILDQYLRAKEQNESGIISSVETYDGRQRFESVITTPEPIELFEHFRNCIESDIEFMSMEVSSQALKYYRTLGIEFDVVCFLNMGTDHISNIEHLNFEDYFSSKLKIFSQGKVACVNLDSDFSDKILERAKKDSPKVVTFSRKDKNADIYAEKIGKSERKTIFNVKMLESSYEITISLPGIFNVENALCAIAVAKVLNIPQKYIQEGLMKTIVPGRMEIFESKDKKVTVIVDFAHNKMSFQALYDTVLKEYPDRIIISVFGAKGNKSYARRQELGEIAGKYSDMIFLTEDHSAKENTLDICEEIGKYISSVGGNFDIEENREEAIRKAIFLKPEKKPVIIVAGKGAETIQKRGKEIVTTPSDLEYVQRHLKTYNEK